MKKFILVNLEDEKSKKLAEVISNKTCRKILDYLSEKNASESEIAKQLKIPISTVHYNLKLLSKNNLIEVEDFCWSDKGNKINIYKIAKKAIIIAPKGSNDLKSKLKGIFSIILISTIVVGTIHLILGNITKSRFSQIEPAMESDISSMAAEKTISGSGFIVPYSSISIISNYVFWFLLGILFTLIIYLIWYWRFKRK